MTRFATCFFLSLLGAVPDAAFEALVQFFEKIRNEEVVAK